MNHRSIRIIFAISGFLILLSVAFYDYLSITHKLASVKLGIKVIPVIILGFTVLSYFLIYRVTIYSIFVLFYLFFCFMGDIFLGLYDPDILDINSDGSMYYYILGGVFFLISRLVLTFNLMVKPWTEIKLITYDKLLLAISHIGFTIPFLGFGIMFLVYYPNFLGGSIFIYFLLGFGPLASYAVMRVNGFNLNNYNSTESKFSQVLAFSGILLFNIADLLLLLGMFFNSIPSCFILISTNIYWVSTFFISASIVRTEDESLERGNILHTYIDV